MNSSISISSAMRAHKRPVHRYVACFLGLFIVVLGGVALVNYIVDPLDELGNNWMGLYASSERNAKPKMLAFYPHNGLIIGSSKTAIIDPLSIPEIKLFNASFSAATPEEILSFLEQYAREGETVLIGLDLFMFNEWAFPLITPEAPQEASFTVRAQKVAAYLLGAKIIRLSWRTITNYLDNAPVAFLPPGNRNPVKKLDRHNSLQGPDYAETLNVLKTYHFAQFRYSTARLETMKRIKVLLKKRHIRYRVYINPLNEKVVDLLKTLPAWADFQKWRQDMRTIFPDLADLSISSYSNPDNFFRQDPFHYLPDAGARFINEILPK